MTFPTASASSTPRQCTATANPRARRCRRSHRPRPSPGRAPCSRPRTACPSCAWARSRSRYPPQCHGVPLVGWDWATTGPHEEADLDGQVTRWGTYAVTGRFDGRDADRHRLGAARPCTTRWPSRRRGRRRRPTSTPTQWDGVSPACAVTPGLLTSVREGDTGPVLRRPSSTTTAPSRPGPTRPSVPAPWSWSPRRCADRAQPAPPEPGTP